MHNYIHAGTLSTVHKCRHAASSSSSLLDDSSSASSASFAADADAPDRDRELGLGAMRVASRRAAPPTWY